MRLVWTATSRRPAPPFPLVRSSSPAAISSSSRCAITSAYRLLADRRRRGRRAFTRRDALLGLGYPGGPAIAIAPPRAPPRRDPPAGNGWQLVRLQLLRVKRGLAPVEAERLAAGRPG